MIDAETSSWVEIAEHLATRDAPAASRLAILPFGALEQHGPHLPLATDTLQAVSLARGIARELGAVLLPAVPYGETWNNAGYTGTVSLSAATVTAVAVDIGTSLATMPAPASGLVLVNGDWGNRAPLHSAARTLVEAGFPAIVLDYPGLDEAAHGIAESRSAAAGLTHAGEIETSMMLAIAPALVKPDMYAVCYPDFPSDFGVRPMQLHPFSQSGVFGDPTPASSEKGRALLDACVAGSLRILRDFAAAL